MVSVPHPTNRSGSTSQTQLHATNLAFSYGGRSLLRNVSLSVGARDRAGLVGANGAGKSTLLKLLVGELTPSAGAVSTTPQSATIGLMRQERVSRSGETVAELIGRQTGVAEATDELEAATAALVDDAEAGADRYDGALNRWLGLGGPDLPARIDDQVGELLGDGAGVRRMETLSGGERAKVWLAAVALSHFDVLLLDEPTNDLDHAGLALMESFVLARSGPTIVVSHDRTFLESIVTEVLEFDPDPRAAESNSGETLRRFGGSWSAYLDAREVAKRHAEEQFSKYEGERSRLVDRARTERSWATTGVAKETKNPRDNDKAQRDFRINKTEKLASRARRTERAMERLEVVDKPWQPWELEFTIGEVERSGDLVAELAGAVVQRGTFELGPVDIAVSAGDRLVIEGPNGSGKTTLVDALFGRIELTAGEQRAGRSVVLGELDQGRQVLYGNGVSLLRSFMDATSASVSEARSTLAKFGLYTDHVDRPVAELSPGEQTRAVLASFQESGVNTLVLDEPTNHLDLPAIEQLEQALTRYAGTLVVISHDRSFIANLDLTSHFTLPA